MFHLALSQEAWPRKRQKRQHGGAGDECCEHCVTPNKNSGRGKDKMVGPERNGEKKEKKNTALQHTEKAFSGTG